MRSETKSLKFTEELGFFHWSITSLKIDKKEITFSRKNFWCCSSNLISQIRFSAWGNILDLHRNLCSSCQEESQRLSSAAGFIWLTQKVKLKSVQKISITSRSWGGGRGLFSWALTMALSEELCYHFLEKDQEKSPLFRQVKLALSRNDRYFSKDKTARFKNELVGFQTFSWHPCWQVLS